MLGEVSAKNVDIRTVAELRLNLLLGRNFVTDYTDDQVLFVIRNLLEKFKLDQQG